MNKLDYLEEEYININGINEYTLQYKGKEDAPVILYIHGGPGNSETCFAHFIEQNFNKDYTIVYYDERGAGNTYLKNKKAKPNIDLLVEDIHETVLYLKKKYNKEKIGIIAHSFGSMLGIKFIKKYPELVQFYIGTGQVVSFYENETVAFQKLNESINDMNDVNDIKAITKLGEYPLKTFNKEFTQKLKKVRAMQKKYNLLSDNKKMIQIAKSSPIYSFKLLIPMLLMMKINKEVCEKMWEFDLYNEDTIYKVPMYFIMGENDNDTPVSIISHYIQIINAPIKELILIKDSGHFPMLDNNKDYISEVNKIIASI